MNNVVHHAIWDEAHVKALLRLLRSPFHLLQEEPWHGWIAEHGGLNAVYAYLRTAPLVPEQRALLELLLQKPHVPSLAYAAHLNIGISTYFIRLRQLTRDLADHLNAWIPAGPPLPATQAASIPEPMAIFPALSPTLAAPSHSFDLPITHTSLIGASDALDTVCELIRQPSTALLTLTGHGGIGKTRLAIEVAKELLHAFQDGVRFVRLDSLHDPALVLIQINKLLGIPEVNSRSALEVLQAWLQNKKILLILDNFEHLMPARPLVSTLLSTVPDLKLLVTSRIPLRLYGERTFQVPPLLLPDLSLPASAEELAAIPAVRLFIERARAINASLALTPETLNAIAQICTHLDGIPLAIELAAARCNLLSPTAMLPYMRQSLSFLTSGPHDFPERHRTLRNTIDWSYTVLDEQEKRLFRRLAVFSGGWTLQAAQEVLFEPGGGQDQVFDVINLLESLFDKSLILNKKGASCEPTRFSMLEIVRQYAFDRLDECGDRQLLQRRHAEYYMAMLEEAEPNLVGPKQQEWIDLLEQERYNIHAALNWALAEREAEMALRMTGAIWNFWHLRSYLSEGQHWLQRAIALGTAVAPHHRALIKVFWGAGWVTCLRNAWPLGERYFQEGLALATAHEDRRGIALALQGLGYISQNRGNYECAQEHFRTSLSICREIGDAEETAWSLDHLAAVAIDCNDYPRAQSYLAESLALFQQLGHHWATLHSLHRLGRVAFLQGNAAQGRAFCEASLKLSREMGTSWMTPQLLTLLAQIAMSQRELEDARALLKEALPLYRDIYSRNGVAVTLETAAALAAANGDYYRAAQLCGAAQLLYDTLRSNKPTPYDEQQREQLLKVIKTQLSSDVFAAAWELGRSLSLEQLITSYA